MRIAVTAILGACFLISAAEARDLVTATVTSVYDGDTFSVEAEIWPGLIWTGSVRVRGVDTPEIRGECDDERLMALLARDYVAGLTFDPVMLVDVDGDKYGGRVGATVLLADGTDLADLLIAEGLGRAYDGGTRQGWC